MTCTLDYYGYDAETEERYLHSSYDLEIPKEDDIVWNSLEEVGGHSLNCLANIKNVRWIVE
jgi:hypothetical protein